LSPSSNRLAPTQAALLDAVSKSGMAPEQFKAVVVTSCVPGSRHFVPVLPSLAARAS
jgi:hypothetical protein